MALLDLWNKDRAQLAEKQVHAFFGASYRDRNKPSNMPATNYGPLLPYKDNWQVFDS
ncbi:MAG: hypothetical protein M0R18_11635 [Deltaproteobacteria bacterium]|jgi:hypothetical protein|nr:hypothetical protein [Deltaproteobacteria bacterium]